MLMELDHRIAPSKIGTPARTLALCLTSLVVMLPWPLLGILLLHSSFDKSTEAFLFFGGITLFPLMILALPGIHSEFMLVSLFMIAWLPVAAVPDLWIRRRLRSWSAVGILLGIQSSFLLAQAVMGALLIIGKNV
ncbi:MAG: hypothetical protein KGS45_13005 [Planctomycetes bacterium]|nr:hypothetical protein [Planctomycetota bacterium]